MGAREVVLEVLDGPDNLPKLALLRYRRAGPPGGATATGPVLASAIDDIALVPR